MAREFNRAQRLSHEIQKEIAIILHQKIKDSRVKMVTVSGVELSRDLGYAKVFVTFLNILDQEHEMNVVKNGIKALNSDMSKYIRFLLAKGMYLRSLPRLIFFYDNHLVEGMRISNLISNAIHNDGKRRFFSKNREKK